MRWFVIPAFAVNLFFAGGLANLFVFLTLCLIVVAFISFLDTQNSRYRIDQAFNFLLTWATLLAAIDLVRASMGWVFW